LRKSDEGVEAAVSTPSDHLRKAKTLAEAVALLDPRGDIDSVATPLKSVIESLAVKLQHFSPHELPDQLDIPRKAEEIFEELRLVQGLKISDQQQRLGELLTETSILLNELNNWRRARAGGASARPEGSRAYGSARGELRKTIGNYREDARRRSRFAAALYVLAFIVVGLATGFGCFLILSRGAELDNTISGFFAQCVPLVAFLVVAVLIAHQAARTRRGADELRRIAYQLDSLDEYLGPLPPPAQALVRAAMTQRLFPRLIDDDPLREVDDWFPGAEDVTKLILHRDPPRQPPAQRRKTAARPGDTKPDAGRSETAVPQAEPGAPPGPEAGPAGQTSER
jgi:hypothetical protein